NDRIKYFLVKELKKIGIVKEHVWVHAKLHEKTVNRLLERTPEEILENPEITQEEFKVVQEELDKIRNSYTTKYYEYFVAKALQRAGISLKTASTLRNIKYATIITWYTNRSKPKGIVENFYNKERIRCAVNYCRRKIKKKRLGENLKYFIFREVYTKYEVAYERIAKELGITGDRAGHWASGDRKAHLEKFRRDYEKDIEPYVLEIRETLTREGITYFLAMEMKKYKIVPTIVDKYLGINNSANWTQVGRVKIKVYPKVKVQSIIDEEIVPLKKRYTEDNKDYFIVMRMMEYGYPVYKIRNKTGLGESKIRGWMKLGRKPVYFREDFIDKEYLKEEILKKLDKEKYKFDVEDINKISLKRKEVTNGELETFLKKCDEKKIDRKKVLKYITNNYNYKKIGPGISQLLLFYYIKKSGGEGKWVGNNAVANEIAQVFSRILFRMSMDITWENCTKQISNHSISHLARNLTRGEADFLLRLDEIYSIVKKKTANKVPYRRPL
ncbi:MAG: hypothetical protein QF475_00465, partial [Candidatus Undinarchaeales archaeon]|nr:hypothetical protein [Candidatus Undinarchaeales archaeon]